MRRARPNRKEKEKDELSGSGTQQGIEEVVGLCQHAAEEETTARHQTEEGVFISVNRGEEASDSSPEELSATLPRKGARPHVGSTPKRRWPARRHPDLGGDVQAEGKRRREGGEPNAAHGTSPTRKRRRSARASPNGEADRWRVRRARAQLAPFSLTRQRKEMKKNEEEEEK